MALAVSFGYVDYKQWQLEKLMQLEVWEKLTPEEQWEVEDAVDLAEKVEEETLQPTADALHAVELMLFAHGIETPDYDC